MGLKCDHIFMAEVSVTAAAAELGVSPRQVARLAHAGELEVTRVVGRAFLLDAASVHRLGQMRRQRGRPWNERVAWAALALLSGQEAQWLSEPERTRLKHRLRRIRAGDVAFFARRRAVTVRMSGWGGIGELVASDRFTVTGVTAIDEDRDLATQFGLASTMRRGVDGYVGMGDFDALAEDYGLINDREGDVTIRVVSDRNPHFCPPHEDTGRRSPIAAVAIDLMDSLDTRERSAGISVLQELINGLR